MNSLPALKCNNCNKEYHRQSAFDKHKLLCIGGDSRFAYPQTPLTTLNHEDGLGDISLRSVIIELVKSNQKLRKDVEELKRWVQAKKKKIIIVDWLNEHCKPEINYKEFMSKLCITRKHLEIIFKSNIIDGIQEILENFMNDEDIPFKSFDQKDNTIYVYNEESKWMLLSSTEFNNIISTIIKSILAEFKNWQDENEQRLYTDDFSVIYVQNVKKVMGGDTTIDKQRIKIHKNLYKYLKMNLQNTIEYEFCA